ncbi:MAG: hypothetical protein K5705_10105 [Oscillospiraceae bacterium]|nr:hypothetical protein [Oscillospiraceae bacterium]
MTDLTDIQAVYRTYFAEAAQAEQNRKPADGLFGIGKKPADDPCHDRFLAALESALQTFAAQKPASGEVRAVLSLIYRMPAEHREPLSVYWMLNAVCGLTQPLIPLLEPADAAALLTQYDADCPRRERLPVQKQIARALKNAGRT